MRMRLCLSVVLGLSAAAAQAAESARPELELKSTLIAKSDQELSGLALAKVGGSEMFTVADEAGDHFIYGIAAGKGGKRYRLEPAIDLARLAGYDDYVRSLATETRVEEKNRRLDLEGLAVCGSNIYVINERVRQVFVIEQGKRLAKAPVNLDSYADLFAGEANAGFEGIAADCERNVLYVAKERDPRRILVIDTKTWTLTNNFDVTPSDREGQRVINPWTGIGLLTVNTDFADLYFDGGYLYALERNTFEIAKIDPKTAAVVARVSYINSERGLYETGEPFGLAEGLLLTGDEIRLVLDNNETPISGTAGQRLGVNGRHSAILVFKRPSGF